MAPLQRAADGADKTSHQKKRLQYSSRFWIKPEAAESWWSGKSSMILRLHWGAPCHFRLCTPCYTATTGESWPRTRATHKVTPWRRKNGKKTPRNAPATLQGMARKTHPADVSRRGPFWTHQRCASLLGTQADSYSMPGDAHPRVHLCLRGRATFIL